jgi:hypothetical protein
MNFLGCDGMWQLYDDGSTQCLGELSTYTVQEMRDFLMPSLTWQQKAELTGAIVGLLACIWVGKKLLNIVPH